MESIKCDTAEEIKEIFKDISNDIFTHVGEIIDCLCND